jgi:hypothetical protein
MRRSPMEQEVERREMQGLMERGIVEPSESPYGTANVSFPKSLTRWDFRGVEGDGGYAGR